jgi:hypothetical protein
MKAEPMLEKWTANVNELLDTVLRAHGGIYLDELLAGLLRKLNVTVPPELERLRTSLEYQPASPV